MSVYYRARASRTGAQYYSTGIETRDASEVFAPESLASWVGAPVTVGHVEVTSANVQDVAVGYVRSVSRDRGDGDDIEYVLAELVIFNRATVALIDARELQELSAGYRTEVVDGRQTRIQIEHLALGPADWARCGPACSIRR